MAFVWFAAVQGVQLFWLTASTYQGSYIYLCYIAVSLWLALQFGALAYCMPKKAFSLRAVFGIAGMWTIIEWSRNFVLCGIAFNPVGLSLTATTLSLQTASLFGMFGLSFWVIVTNLLGYRALQNRKRWPAWVVAAILPYIFGAFHVYYHTGKMDADPSRRVTLVQTGLLPDEKNFFPNQIDAYYPPFMQWEHILGLLPENPGIIVLPEAVIPYHYSEPIFPIGPVCQSLRERWGTLWLKALPPLEMPYAEERGGQWYVSHAFWAQAIANFYEEEVIGGFSDADREGVYNAAFHLFPMNEKHVRYDKRILVPLAEYLPLKSLSALVANYGIIGEFSHGMRATVSGDKIPLSISICYEECFGHMMREGKKQGAALYVNLTNDGWFSFSNLPLYHFDHSRPRTVENGVPLIRASNTGGTAIVDSLGRTLLQTRECYKRSVITGSVPLYNYTTLYTSFGDWMIIAVAFLAVAQYCLVLKRGLR
jgi:apolipoprotein N-acyltransferase